MKLCVSKSFVQSLLLVSIISICCAASCKKTTGNNGAAPAGSNPAANVPGEVALWLTKGDGSIKFQKQNNPLKFSNAATNQNAVITIDTTQAFQTMEGFGYTLTGGSAGHLMKMSAAGRTAFLKELFATDGNNIGVSYLRISIGASDLNERVFSYDDVPAGETDPGLTKFDLGPDKTDVIPVLKEVLQINPTIKILGSPWSPPAWMKTNGDTRGGSLKPEYYNVYAQYLVKYIQAMKSEGISINAITVQNEPLHPGNNPSLLMLPEDQRDFIKQSLGPAFKSANISTKIIVYDHNADRPDYPITIYHDAAARQYVDGAAFHLYAGAIDALSGVHNAYPDKNLYFTEQWIGAPGNFPEDVKWHVRTLIIGAPRNWCRTVLEWNLSSNPQLAPYTDRGGCNKCLGAVTIDGDQVTRNPAYYIIAHASKFVRPGSVRIESNSSTALPNVAYKTPDGKKVVIVLNDAAASQTFAIRFGGKEITTSLDAGAVGTYVF